MFLQGDARNECQSYPGTFTFPGCRFLISKLVCCLPNFVLEKLSQDHQPDIVHSSESCQKLPGWLRSEEKGLHGGWKEMICALRNAKMCLWLQVGTSVWKAKSSPAIPPLLQFALSYSLWTTLRSTLRKREPQARGVTKQAIYPTWSFHFVYRQKQSCHHQTARSLIQAKFTCLHKAPCTLGTFNTSGK